ncbi:MAG: cation transporter [Rhodospirillaceae bacterium]
MSGCCDDDDVGFDGSSVPYRNALIAVILINGAMFGIEATVGFAAMSQALKADALDFLGDTLTYAISLWAVGKSLTVRARTAFIKGVSLGAMGLIVLAITAYRVIIQGSPDGEAMGLIGGLALAANLISALILLKFRNGDANVQSVWLCTRNDAIGNVAVICAAGLVIWTASPWPDLIVAAAMAALFLQSSVKIIRQARGELAAAA